MVRQNLIGALGAGAIARRPECGTLMIPTSGGKLRAPQHRMGRGRGGDERTVELSINLSRPPPAEILAHCVRLDFAPCERLAVTAERTARALGKIGRRRMVEGKTGRGAFL